MTKNRTDTLLIPYAYGINTPNTPRKYGIDTVSIHKRQRDKETKRLTTVSKRPTECRNGSLALEGVKASRSRSEKRHPKKPNASKVDFSKGVHVFTDGACDPNPGPGGWAFVVYENGYAIHSETGSDAVSTNNRMEMQAALAALGWMLVNAIPKAQLHTDSQYTSRGANEWRHGWKRRGWMRGESPIPNADLWQQMDAALEAFPVTLNWVRGHSGIAGNEAADRLAVSAMKRGLRERRGAA